MPTLEEINAQYAKICTQYGDAILKKIKHEELLSSLQAQALELISKANQLSQGPHEKQEELKV